MPVPGEAFGRYFGAGKPELERQEQERLEQERLEELNLDRLRMIGGEVIKLSVLEPGEGQPEIFDTIQGEGRNMGKHTAFLRLSECNQSCSWCDTPQTWAFTEAKAARHDTETVYNKLDWQVKKEVEDIVEQVFATNPESLVITGGEPLMQQNAVINLIKGLREKNPDYHTEIETAGTIVIKDELLELLDQINCSPKIANSGNPFNKRRKPLALQKLAEAEKTDFKFVVTKEEDVEEILELVELSGVSNDRVFLMPEGRTPEEIQQHSVMVGDLVKKHGFNMTTRLHILMYGAKRNV